MPAQIPAAAGFSRISWGEVLVLLGRALRRRCPHCGLGPLYAGWARMLPRCPHCGLSYTRGDQGYLVGSYVVNLIAAELIFMALFIGVLVATWPDPPWTALQWGAPVLMLGLPALFHPFARALFLAADTVMRPVTEAELRGERDGATL